MHEHCQSFRWLGLLLKLLLTWFNSCQQFLLYTDRNDYFVLYCLSTFYRADQCSLLETDTYIYKYPNLGVFELQAVTCLFLFVVFFVLWAKICVTDNLQISRCSSEVKKK